MRLRVIALVTVVVAGALGTLAHAQDKPDFKQARDHYNKATKALDQGDYAIAAREFGTAYQITKDPILFFKIALSYQKAGDCESALIYYGRYIKEANPPDQDRADAEARVGECKTALGQGDDGGAAPAPDDTGAGAPDAAEATAMPDPDDAPAPPVGDGDQPTFVAGGSSWQRSAAWISVGVAVAAGTAGAVLGLSASSREEDLDTLLGFRDPTTGEPRPYEGEVKRQYDEFISEGEDLETYSTIAWGVAGAGAIAAIVFFVLDPGSSDPEFARTLPVAPVVGTDTVGVSAGWEF